MAIEKITIPDFGDVQKITVVEVFIAAGDKVEEETSLIALESEKAVMDIPSPFAGVINEVLVKEDDVVGSGDVIALVDTGGDARLKRRRITRRKDNPSRRKKRLQRKKKRPRQRQKKQKRSRRLQKKLTKRQISPLTGPRKTCEKERTQKRGKRSARRAGVPCDSIGAGPCARKADRSGHHFRYRTQGSNFKRRYPCSTAKA